MQYLTAENFANQMVQALKSGRMPDFKERFRKDCDVLLLEEVQFLSGKEKIQAEVCYTLDTLMDQNKRLVFTSCYLPGEISQLSQELRSRLTGGVITPIGAPDFPTRVQILAHKADHRGVQVPAKILEYLAEYVTEDVRRLESALDCLLARASLLKEPLSLRLAQEVLQDLRAVDARLSTPQIQKIVGDYYGVSLAEMLGRSRQKRLVRARQLAPLFLPDLYRKDYGAVGAPLPAQPCLRGPRPANPGAGPQDPSPAGSRDPDVGAETGPGPGQVGDAESIHSSH